MSVDMIVLSRDLKPLRGDVLAGIGAQDEVGLVVHRLTGTHLREDPNTWATIVRARNRARTLGDSPWVMLLDDDVVLGPGCVARLMSGLEDRPEFAALAADTAGVMENGWEHWDYPSHVGMAAVLFRRERLVELTFRWEEHRCECLCCSDDLRSRGLAIGYQPGALGWHRPHPVEPRSNVERNLATPIEAPDPIPRTRTRRSGRQEGRILAAFDRRDHVRFRSQFLRTLRANGNAERVWAFAYGLFPTEIARLAVEPNVEVVPVASNGVCPALRRLRDFQPLLESWTPEMPVAYWDGGDIFFQGRVQALWDAVDERPGILHVVAEPLSYPENPIIPHWCSFIRDLPARDRAFDVLSSMVFLNSGFAAGTVDAMLDYLREGDRLLNSVALDGVGDWGDQPAMNLYCHENPERYIRTDAGWNFALAGRPRDQYWLSADGIATRTDGGPIHVLHGNAHSLRWVELLPSAVSVE